MLLLCGFVAKQTCFLEKSWTYKGLPYIFYLQSPGGINYLITYFSLSSVPIIMTNPEVQGMVKQNTNGHIKCQGGEVLLSQREEKWIVENNHTHVPQYPFHRGFNMVVSSKLCSCFSCNKWKQLKQAWFW